MVMEDGQVIVVFKSEIEVGVDGWSMSACCV